MVSVAARCGGPPSQLFDIAARCLLGNGLQAVARGGPTPAGELAAPAAARASPVDAHTVGVVAEGEDVVGAEQHPPTVARAVSGEHTTMLASPTEPNKRQERHLS